MEFGVRIKTWISIISAALLFCVLIFNVVSHFSYAYAEQAPQLLLAKTYKENLDLSDYWLSEKLDGVRAYWDGEYLLSRQGNQFIAPAWFIADLPNHPLDGELWVGRGQFETTLSTVSKQRPDEQQWRKVKYMLFELPPAKGSFAQPLTFTERLDTLKKIVEKINLSHIQVVAQTRMTHDPQALQIRLEKVVKAGGEGLMLHRAGALYKVGRSDDLLKVKQFEDAEATVIAHSAGKGKHKGRLGALVVRTADGLEFKIGTGFSDHERENPVKIGCQVTYKFYGLTGRGVPRFASFLRQFARDPKPKCQPPLP